MDKNMNHDDIKKIVSETVSNPDVLSFIVKQIQDQIEKEQSKVEPKNDNHTKDKINDIKSKADNYTTNNEHLNKYMYERDKYMDVFKRVTETISTEKANTEKEITQEPSKKTWTQNISQVSMMHNFSDGWYKWYQESTDGKVWGNLFFDLLRNKNNNFETFLNIYSVLNLYADEWENWEVDHFDNIISSLPISKLEDTYTYNFTKEESEIINSMEDTVHSYTHVEIDNELPMVSIYIIDYSKKTNKVYDFNRIIFTPSDYASEEDIKRFYWHLFNYFSDESNVSNVLDDYCYTFINKYIIHGVSIMSNTDEEYYKMMNLYLMSILEPKKKESMKVETVEIKATDTPDKTNSILDKLGIPHNNGVVDIPISDDKFILNRNNVMDKAFDCDKEEFTDEDCLSDYVEDICKKCEFNEECKEEYKKEEQEYDAYLEKLLNRHEIWDDDVWWEKIFDFFKGDSEDTFIKANDDFIIYMSFKNKIGKNIKDSELYSTYKIDKNNLTITIIEADPSEGFDVSWVGKLSMMINPIVDSDDKYEEMLSYKNMYPLISDLTVKMCENVEIDPHKDIYYFKNKNNFTHNNLYKAVTDIILECINYFYNNITDKDK